MAVTAVPGTEIRRPVPRLRLLEDERWLAMALLFPTALLLGLVAVFAGIWIATTEGPRAKAHLTAP